jgi:hypothetical protein
VDSVRKLLTGGLHEAVALCLLLSVVLGGLGQTLHKALTRRFGATATRLLSNLQARNGAFAHTRTHARAHTHKHACCPT